MKRISFTLSIVFSEIGCILLFVTVLLEKTIPVIGKMASQLSDTKAYGDSMYLVDYNLNYFIRILMIIVGVALTIYFYRKEKQD